MLSGYFYILMSATIWFIAWMSPVVIPLSFLSHDTADDTLVSGVFDDILFQGLVWHNTTVNTMRPTQTGRYFADDIFKRIFLYEKVIISIRFSPKFFLKGPINDKSALVQIMAWRLPGDKSLSEPIMVYLTDVYICLFVLTTWWQIALMKTQAKLSSQFCLWDLIKD